MKFNRNVLGVRTSYPTVDGVPTDDIETADTIDPGKTKTSVAWPMNWHMLTPKWRAAILAQLVKRVIESVLSGGSLKTRSETYEAFKKLTGWGSNS